MEGLKKTHNNTGEDEGKEMQRGNARIGDEPLKEKIMGKKLT